MRRASIAIMLALAACGGHGTTGGDDANGGGDDGNGGGDDGSSQQPTNVTLTLHDRPNNAALFSFVVAYADGAGAWQLAPAPSGDTYTLPIYSPAYSVAFTCIGGGNASTTVQSRTVTTASWSIAERASLVFDVPPRCTDRNTGGVGLHGTIANTIGNGGGFVVKWGDRTANAVGNQGVTTCAMEGQPG